MSLIWVEIVEYRSLSTSTSSKRPSCQLEILKCKVSVVSIVQIDNQRENAIGFLNLKPVNMF